MPENNDKRYREITINFLIRENLSDEAIWNEIREAFEVEELRGNEKDYFKINRKLEK